MARTVAAIICASVLLVFAEGDNTVGRAATKAMRWVVSMVMILLAESLRTVGSV